MKKNKRLLSALLAGIMLIQLPMMVFQVSAQNSDATPTADLSIPKNEFGIDVSIPTDFDPNDGENPYGDGWVNMTPTHELIMHEALQSTAISEVGDVRLSYYNYDATSQKAPESTSFTNPGNVGSTFFDATSTTDADINREYLSVAGEPTAVSGGTNNYLHFARGVAYDPNGTGKDDHVAYYGFDKTNNYSSILLRSEADADPYVSGNKITLLGANDNVNGEQYKYIQNVPWYQGESINSIVAGDFDGDGKDTLIVFDPAANFGAIREFSGASGYTMISYADFAGTNYSGAGFAGGQNYLYDLYTSFFGAYYGGTVDKDNAQYNMPYVHFAAGNLDNDPEDELVMTVSAGNITAEKDANFGNKSSFIVVLDKSSGTWTEKYRASLSNIKIDQIPNEAYPATLGFHMQSASSAIGDFSGNDGINEIVTIGTINNQSRDNADIIDQTTNMMAVVTLQTADGGLAPALVQEAGANAGNPNQMLTVGHFLPLTGNSVNDYVRYTTYSTNQPPLSLGLVQFDGVGTSEYVVAQGVIFRYENNVFSPATFAQSREGITNIFDGEPRYISQPTIGSFSGFAGEESVMFSTWYEHGGSGMYVVGYHKQQIIEIDDMVTNAPSDDFKRVNTANVMNGQMLSSWWYTDSHYTTIPVLIAADYDDDQTMIRYKSKEYTFSDPEVMALIEVSPYFEALAADYNSPGYTEFGVVKGEGEGQGKSTEFSVGAFAGVDWENVTGEMGAKFSVGYSADIGTEWETEEVFTREIAFSVEHAEEHQVVMLAVPVTIYTYDQKFPNGNVSTMTLQMADAPRYSSIGVSQYSAVQTKSGNKYPDLSNILTSEPGKPATYTAPNENVGKTAFTALFENLVEANHDATITRQTLTNEHIDAETQSVTHNINTSFEGVYNMALIGIDFSAGFGTSTMTMDISGMNRTGAVAPIPAEKSNYDFDWRFTTWMEEFTNEENQKYTVPVLAYEVANVVEERKAPTLTAIATSDSTIDLSWVDNAAISGDGTTYEIFQVSNIAGTPQYTSLYEVSVGSEEMNTSSYTHTGLQADTNYTYVITATTPQQTTVEGDPTSKTSPYSNEADATTFALGETVGITIDPQPMDMTVEVGSSATFTVGASADSPTASLGYIWQELKPKASGWANISGANSATLTVANTTLADSGTLYRCMVYDINAGNNPPVLISDYAQLTVVQDLILGSTTIITAVSDVLGGAVADNATVAKNNVLDVDMTIGLDDGSIPQNSKLVLTLSANGRTHAYTSFFTDITSGEFSNKIKLEDLNLSVGDTFTLQSELFSTADFVGSKSAVKTYAVGAGMNETYTIEGLQDSYVYSTPVGVTGTRNNVADQILTDAEMGRYDVLFAQGDLVSPIPVHTYENTTEINDLILDVGEYVIIAYDKNNVQLSEKRITVTKNPITITAPTDSTQLTTETVGSHIVVGDVTANKVLVSSTPQTGLFAYTPPTMTLEDMFVVGISNEADGYYPIVNYSADITGNIQEQITYFQKNYEPTFVRGGALNVNDFVSTRYEVNFGSKNESDADFGSISAFSKLDGYFSSGATMAEGDTLTFTVNEGISGIPNVVKWTVNGNDVTTANMAEYAMTTPTDRVLTVNDLNEATTVVAVLDEATTSHIVSASSTGNGTISPSGDILVEDGGSVEFTFTPDNGYEIGELLVDGMEIVFSGNTYKVSNVTKPTSVQVSFNIPPAQTYNVSFNSNGGNGLMADITATENVATQLPQNEFEAPIGKKFKEWAIGNANSSIKVAAGGTYTFTQSTEVFAVWVDEDTVIHTITASDDGNGSISPSGDVKIEDGQNQSFTFTPNAKYEIDSVLVDGVKVEVFDNKYTIENVGKDMSISASFSRKTIEDEEEVIINEEIDGDEDEEGINKGVVDEEEMEEIVDKVIEEAIEKGKTPLVNITMKTPVDAKGVAIDLPAEQLKKLGAANGALLTLNCGEYQATFDSKAILAMSETGNARIVVEIINADKSELNQAQKDKVGDAPVFDLSIISGDTVISDFKGGSAIITLPYDLAEGQSKDDVVVYFIDSKGDIQAMNTVYDVATKTVSFTTPHFSYYYIADANTDTEVPGTGDTSTSPIVLVGIMLVSTLGLIIISKTKLIKEK